MSEGNKPDLAGLALLTIRGDETHNPPVMYIWHNGKKFEAQDYFAHWGPTPYIRADLSQASVAAALEEAAGIAYKAWDGEPEDGEAVRSEIRALITPDQRTALQAAIDAGKSETRRGGIEPPG